MIDTQRKAGSVILANLAMFDESVVLFENEISPAFLKAFDKVVDDFAKEESWFVVASFADDEDCCWFALPSWNMGIEDRNDYSAWLAVTNYSDGDNSFYLANLCGIGEALGFKFSVGAKHFGGVRKWNNFYLNAASDFQSALADLGFSELKNGEFFIPITLSLEKVVQAWDDEAYDEAMQPVIDVLEKVKQAMPIWGSYHVGVKSAILDRK
jgi:hypothetical protein